MKKIFSVIFVFIFLFVFTLSSSAASLSSDTYSDILDNNSTFLQLKSMMADSIHNRYLCFRTQSETVLIEVSPTSDSWSLGSSSKHIEKVTFDSWQRIIIYYNSVPSGWGSQSRYLIQDYDGSTSFSVNIDHVVASNIGNLLSSHPDQFEFNRYNVLLAIIITLLLFIVCRRFK